VAATTSAAATTAASANDGDTAADTAKPIFEPLGTGVRRDFARRLPRYPSDLRDGLNSQSLATILFLFFACLAPAIGFGGVLDAATGGSMGTIEMIVSTAACGVTYALASAQPIQLIGPMGPNLAFAISLYGLAKALGVPFLPLYAWTGLWTGGMLMVAALTSASNSVQYLTRFTDEIFSVLISAIFLFGAVSDVGSAFSSPATSATTALLTLTCASLTFGSALVLKGLKTSPYFTRTTRTNLSNFAPAIGVALGSLAARAARLKYGPAVAALPALSIPIEFATTTGRPWVVPLLDLPVWARWGAALPAVLASVLLFLDQNITARLVNHPRYKMVKGRDPGSVLDGMHGDMLVLSFLTVATSVLGLPWMAGATTRSAAHVRSLSVYSDDGTTISGTLENRVTGASIHAMIGACALFPAPRALLAQVPLPVLSGVFLYLGMTSLQGLELWDRVRELFQDAGAGSKNRWSGVPRGVVGAYTLAQIACVGAMMKVTQSSFGVVSPLMIAFLPLLRIGLVKFGIIKQQYIEVLDE